MKAEALTEERLQGFLNYCKRHRTEVDESFLDDRELNDFGLSKEHPTYTINNHQGEVVAAASLIRDEYQRRGRRARFRIFHSEIGDIKYYQLLFEAMLKHTEGLDMVYLFVPLTNKKLANFMEDLQFSIERYSFLLVREGQEPPEFILPEGYEIKAFRPGHDEDSWCKVRNAAFATLKGNETPITPEMMTKLISGDDYIEGSMLLLYHDGRPVGVVRGEADEYEGTPMMNIGPLAIIPEYQGKGLGRMLLRASLQFAKEHYHNRTVLSVNGENERAKALYLQEGFKQVEGVVCYRYDLSP